MNYPHKNLKILRLSALFIALLTAGCASENASVNGGAVASVEPAKSVNTETTQPADQLESNSNISDADNPNDPDFNTDIQTSKSDELLYDFRRVDEYAKPQTLSAREEKLVLGYAFGAAKSDLVLTGTVSQRINGSFTQTSSDQTLYLASGSEDPHKIVAIYEGTQPLFRVKFEGEEILKTIDLDRDGRDELLITKGDSYMYGRTLDAQIIRITESKVEVIKTFNKICETADSLNHEKTSGEVAVISYSPANQTGAYPVQFAVKRYNCAGAQGAIDPKTCRAK